MDKDISEEAKIFNISVMDTRDQIKFQNTSIHLL